MWYEPVLPYVPFLALVGLALLAILCLPFSGTRKLILEVYGLALRLALLALVAGATVLWFRPDLLPAECEKVLNAFPQARDILPAPRPQVFGAAVAGLLAAVLLPLLAVVDVTRKLAGWRLRRLRVLTREARVETVSTPAGPSPAAPAAPPPAQRRVDRRAAAEAMAQAGS